MKGKFLLGAEMQVQEKKREIHLFFLQVVKGGSATHEEYVCFSFLFLQMHLGNGAMRKKMRKAKKKFHEGKIKRVFFLRKKYRVFSAFFLTPSQKKRVEKSVKKESIIYFSPHLNKKIIYLAKAGVSLVVFDIP